MESDVYASGNRDANTASIDVLRKIKSEFANSWIEDKHVVLSILHQKKKFEDESEKNIKIQSYLVISRDFARALSSIILVDGNWNKTFQ